MAACRTQANIDMPTALTSSTQSKMGSGSYILCSILPPAFRTPRIFSPSLAPSAEAEAVYTAFYSLIVACIYLSGGELSDQKLKRHLCRLNADRNVWHDKTELVLKRMEKHGYIVRRVERPPVGQDGESTVTWHIGTRAKEEIGLGGVIGMVKEVYGEETEGLDKKLKSSLVIKSMPGAGEATVVGNSNSDNSSGGQQ
jgi:melanoma-associated antigen